MSANRRVRSLRLRAPTAAVGRRAALLVEDALRTASIPDADGGRVYVVRRLSLPAVRTSAPSATIARSIEHRLSSLRTTAVHASDPRAAHADVVYFDDDADAGARLLRMLLVGDASAWFWRCIEPAQLARSARAERVRAALLRLAEAAGAPVALPHTVALALAERWLDPLLEVVRPEDGAALLHALVPTFATTSSVRIGAPPDGAALASLPAAGDTPAVSSARWADVVRAWSRRWDGDARALWLATAAIVAVRPAMLAAPQRLAAAAHAAVATARSAEPNGAPIPTAEVHPRLRGPATVPPMAQPAAEAVMRAAEPRASPARPESPAVEAPTSAGGLLFVVQLLRRTGFDAFLASHAGAEGDGLGLEVLRAIAQRTGTPPDDAMLAALGIALEDAALDLSDASEWVRAVRRWSRVNARLGLHTLVRRPARIASTRTHIDVTFALRTADVRLRRAGLDLDPGWVPWLGRVVLFHYGERGRP